MNRFMFSQSSKITMLIILAGFVFLLSTASSIPSSEEGDHDHISTELNNANHIFNAIHSSMRQWDSSLQHNGMSFFLASVPEGTQFYHGTSTSQPVLGVEWLAFEPEHALGFARPHGIRGPGGPGHKKPEQRPLNHDGPGDDAKPGFVHTYAAAKDLRLLYIDGMAAGKTTKGTLDAQDLILLNYTLPPRGGGSGEKERADLACKIAAETWDRRIDGFLRMEAGFEIILCSFEQDLDVVRITQAKPPSSDGDRGKDGGSRMNSWLQAVAARYHGIGGNRVSVNFDQFVTAYTYGLDLFTGNDSLPRLRHLSTKQLEPIRRDLHDFVMSYDALETSFDWQAVTDMITTRYSDELQYLISGKISSASSLHVELEGLLQPFIDYSEDNGALVIDRCSKQFIPRHAPKGTLAGEAIQSVSRSICSTLYSALDFDLETAVTSFRDLATYLSWTAWKDCRGCDYGQLCVIPMWPAGTVEDYENPICQDINAPLRPGENYWGDRMRN